MKKIFVLSLAVLLVTAAVCSADEQANLTGNEGLMLIQKGQMDEGLKLMKKATGMAPEDAGWHMNYGSMLFAKGQQMFETGLKEEARGVFKDAENELLAAVKLFGQADAMPVSQCYFLLGDIYFYVHEDKARAKAFYQQSLDHYPQHGGSLEAMKRVP